MLEFGSCPASAYIKTGQNPDLNADIDYDGNDDVVKDVYIHLQYAIVVFIVTIVSSLYSKSGDWFS